VESIPRPFRLASQAHPESQNIAWVVPGFIPQKGVVILASAPKTGKTCLANAIARAVATGDTFLANPVLKGPVLWCAHEEISAEQRRLHEGLTDQDQLYVAYPDGLPALDEEGEGEIYRLPYVFGHALHVKAALIVIDSLHAAVRKTNLSDNHAARRVISKLRMLCDQYSVACLILHHLTKSSSRGHAPDRFADSSQILAAATTHFTMESIQDVDGSRKITLYGQGRFPAPFSKVTIRSDGIHHYKLLLTDTQEATRPTARHMILAYLAEGRTPTSRELATAISVNPQTVRNTLVDLQRENLVMRFQEGNGPAKYRRRSFPVIPTPTPEVGSRMGQEPIYRVPLGEVAAPKRDKPVIPNPTPEVGSRIVQEPIYRVPLGEVAAPKRDKPVIPNPIPEVGSSTNGV
jgi:hypothetical protein